MQKIQFEVFKIQNIKKEIMKKFDDTMYNLEKDAENDSLELLRVYLNKKKHCDRIIERENKDEDWQIKIDEVVILLDK